MAIVHRSSHGSTSMGSGPSLLRLLLPISVLFSVSEGATSCYKNNGQLWQPIPDAPVAPWVPCNVDLNNDNTSGNNGSVSVCCSQDDFCLSNGLCLIQHSGDGNKMLFAQEGCTDPNWPAPCKNFCPNKGDDVNGYMFPWQCQDLSWCCGAKDEDCCNTADRYFPIDEPTAIQAPVTRLKSTGTPSNTPSESPAASNALVTTSCPPGEGTVTDNSKALAIGLGVGIPVAAAITIGALTFLWFYKRRSAAREASSKIQGRIPPTVPGASDTYGSNNIIYPPSMATTLNYTAPPTGTTLQGAYYQEAYKLFNGEHRGSPGELSGSPRHGELPG